MNSKKTIPFLLITFFLSTIVFAQQSTSSFRATSKAKKSRLGFNIGMAVPSGDFANTDLFDQKSGFATTGKDLQLNYQYQVDYFALSAQVGRANYGVDQESFASEVRKQVTGSTPGTVSVPGTIQVNSSDYSCTYLFIGVKLIFGNEVQAYIQPFMGTSYLVAPEVNISIVTNGDEVKQIQQEYSSDFTLTYGVSGGAYFRATDEISFNANAAFITTEYELNPTLVVKQGGKVKTSSESYKQPIISGNYTIGIAYHF